MARVGKAEERAQALRAYPFLPVLSLHSLGLRSDHLPKVIRSFWAIAS